jgi:ABC-type Fe3+/spermidine/putrescine transport system ATPase subunit
MNAIYKKLLKNVRRKVKVKTKKSLVNIPSSQYNFSKRVILAYWSDLMEDFSLEALVHEYAHALTMADLDRSMKEKEFEKIVTRWEIVAENITEKVFEKINKKTFWAGCYKREVSEKKYNSIINKDKALIDETVNVIYKEAVC